MIAFHRGDAGAARHRLTLAVQQVEQQQIRGLAELTAARALGCEHAGRPQEALTLLTKPTVKIYATESWLADAVRLAVALREKATAAAVAARAETLPGVRDIPRLQAIALHCRGLLDADPDLLAEATWWL